MLHGHLYIARYIVYVAVPLSYIYGMQKNGKFMYQVKSSDLYHHRILFCRFELMYKLFPRIMPTNGSFIKFFKKGLVEEDNRS